MAPTKHRDDQLFTGPVTFKTTIVFDEAVSFSGVSLNISAPGAGTNTEVLTVAELLGGIFVQTPSAATTTTVPTGAALTAALNAELAVGDSFDFILINIGTTGDDITFTMATGITLVGSAIVRAAVDAATEQAGQAIFRFRNSGAGVWIAYRIA